VFQQQQWDRKDPKQRKQNMLSAQSEDKCAENHKKVKINDARNVRVSEDRGGKSEVDEQQF